MEIPRNEKVIGAGQKVSDRPWETWCAACGEWVGKARGDAEKHGLKEWGKCTDRRCNRHGMREAA